MSQHPNTLKLNSRNRVQHTGIYCIQPKTTSAIHCQLPNGQLAANGDHSPPLMVDLSTLIDTFMHFSWAGNFQFPLFPKI